MTLYTAKREWVHCRSMLTFTFTVLRTECTNPVAGKMLFILHSIHVSAKTAIYAVPQCILYLIWATNCGVSWSETVAMQYLGTTIQVSYNVLWPLRVSMQLGLVSSLLPLPSGSIAVQLSRDYLKTVPHIHSSSYCRLPNTAQWGGRVTRRHTH